MLDETARARAVIGPDLGRHIRANPVAGTPAQMRAAFARLAGPQPGLRSVTLGGTPCLVAGEGPPAAIWLHGGGYVFGGATSHGHAVSRLSARLGRAVVMPCYRLAPETTWPGQLDDALAVLDAVAGPVALVGDSAGGHLALHLAFARPGRVTSVALIGANTDRSGQSRTRVANSDRDLTNDHAQDDALAQMALPGAHPRSAEASPLLGPLGRLPRLWLTCAEDEVLADDSRLLARAAGRAGVAAELHEEQGLFHMWTLWPHVLPAAARTIEKIARWTDRPG